MAISQAHLDHWREHGYVVVDGLVSGSELAEAQREFAHLFPTWDEKAAEPRKYRQFRKDDPHEGHGLFIEHFPFSAATPRLADNAIHPDLLDFARRAMGTDDIALGAAEVVAKYAGFGGDYEQGLHLDFNNNTPVVPSVNDSAMEDLACIIYYSDVTIDLGPTYVVSTTHARNEPVWPSFRDGGHPLYAHEQPALAKAGSALLYTMRTWHRGSRMIAKRGHRFAQHITLHNGAYRWLGAVKYYRSYGTQEAAALMARSTPRQRWALGFPLPGNPYWDGHTLAAAKLRYPGIDFAPYAAAMSRTCVTVACG
jgi:ectoine hydroxylase-related dioxygenase (phytanoyl-CoA dioxygenase family)